MSHPDYDADLRGHVERVLSEFLHESSASIRQREPAMGNIADKLRDFVLNGGKRLRPTFAWWAWRGVGGDPAGSDAAGVLRAVASLELIQACALIHDDVMDSSESRRGAPTVHVAFAKQHTDAGWFGSAATYGLASAVVTGDLALVWAEDMFAESPLPAVTLTAARSAWRAMRTEMLTGQHLDMHAQAVGDSSAQTALRIDQLKTAAYTVQRPLHIGAALAGADEDLIDTLLRFGGDLGVAFQLRDDLLGLFGDPVVTGKPAGDDLREGKRTLLISLGLRLAEQQSEKAAHELISAAIGDVELTQGDVQKVRAALVELGAVDAVEQRIDSLTQSALEILRGATLTEPAVTQLAELASKATDRSL